MNTLTARTRTLALGIAAALAALAPSAAAQAVLDPMDTAPLAEVGSGGQTSQLVDGRTGTAVLVSFPANASGKYLRTRVRGSDEWDAAAGFSFWVKGDGSKECGSLQFIWNEDYAARYDVAFPIDSTEWRKITVAWDDLIPVLPKPSCLFLGTGAGRNAPSKLSQAWIGKWWYWRDAGAYSFAVDQFQLEGAIPRDAADYRPADAPLARVLARLKTGAPVTIVTMGDSLTDIRHWANREVNWPAELTAALSRSYRSRVRLVNPAIGGTELRQNLVLAPRWLAEAPSPDLITICFGYNDWSSGMRGPMFRETLAYAVARLRRLTKGASDILIVTTCPAVERWDEMAELAEACRLAARDTNAGLADTYAAFHRAGGERRERLYCTDKTHMGPEGHRLIASTVAGAVERAGR